MEASHIDIGIDCSRSAVSHTPWLTRGELNCVTITVVDADSEAVYGVSSSDVLCSFSGDSEVVGWFVVSVHVSGNKVSLGITLESTCSEASTLDVRIVSARFRCPLKVRDHLPLPVFLCKLASRHGFTLFVSFPCRLWLHIPVLSVTTAKSLLVLHFRLLDRDGCRRPLAMFRVVHSPF